MERFMANGREAAEDIYFGQVVIIWARWFVILAAAVLALWSSDQTSELATRALMIIGLMGINFFLHGRSLMELPANQSLLLLSGLIDLTLIGLIVAFWGQGGGIESELYVLYYPIVFAFALVFAQRIAAGYGLLAIASYAAICVASDPGFISESDDAKAFAMRIITIAATATLGSFYWRIQRARRRAQNDQIHAYGQ